MHTTAIRSCYPSFFQIFSFYLYERRGGREENSGEERERERIRERG